MKVRRRDGRGNRLKPVTSESPTMQLLFQIIDQRKISHQSLAEEVGVTRTAISNMRSGRSYPSIATVEKIAQCLNLRIMLMGIDHGA